MGPYKLYDIIIGGGLGPLEFSTLKMHSVLECILTEGILLKYCVCSKNEIFVKK
jgi:hypothetical protein